MHYKLFRGGPFVQNPSETRAGTLPGGAQADELALSVRVVSVCGSCEFGPGALIARGANSKQKGPHFPGASERRQLKASAGVCAPSLSIELGLLGRLW